MKAMVYTKYGSPEVLSLQDVAKPVPQKGEVLVRIHASSVNVADVFMIKGDPFIVRIMSGGLFAPKFQIPGADMCGTVEETGPEANEFKPGDVVFADLSECGWGGYAQYKAVPEKYLVKKPSNLSVTEGGVVPLAGVTAWQGLIKHGKLQKGETVGIHGATGGVGTFAVQIAKATGATVTATCSTGKMDLVRSLGADTVIDYKSGSLVSTGEQFDLIAVVNGTLPLSEARKALKPTGRVIVIGGDGSGLMEVMMKGPFLSKKNGQQFSNMLARPVKADLESLKNLIESADIHPVMEQQFDLENLAKAVTFASAGHAAGKTGITIG